MTHSPRQTKRIPFPRRAALLLTGCAAEITRDAAHGGPAVQRLSDTPPASLSSEERQRLRALDEQVMREQDAAQERRLREAQARARAREAYWAHYGWGWNYWGWGPRPYGLGMGGGFPYYPYP